MKKLSPSRILCTRVDRLGDILVTTPFLRAMRQAYPHAQIDVLTSPAGFDALQNNPHISGLFVFHKRKPLSWFHQLLPLYLRSYDWVINLQGPSKTCRALTLFARGEYSEWTLEQPEPKIMLHDYGIPNHISLSLLRYAHTLGCTSVDSSMEFVVSASVQQQVSTKWPVPPGKLRVALFIGNSKKKHARWPEGKFAALAKLLKEDPKVDLYIMTGPGDENLLAPFGQEYQVYNADESLENSAAFLATCGLFVTSSTGPKHLAAAVKTPCVSILHRENFAYWAPLGEEHTHVVSSHQDGEHDVRSICVEEVYAAVVQKLDFLHSGPAPSTQE